MQSLSNTWSGSALPSWPILGPAMDAQHPGSPTAKQLQAPQLQGPPQAGSPRGCGALPLQQSQSAFHFPPLSPSTQRAAASAAAMGGCGVGLSNSTSTTAGMAYPASPTSRGVVSASTFPVSPTRSGQLVNAGRRSPTPGSVRVRGATVSGKLGSPVRQQPALTSSMQQQQQQQQQPSTSLSPTRQQMIASQRAPASPTRPMASRSPSSPTKPMVSSKPPPDFLEDADKIEKWLSSDAVRARRERLGLNDEQVLSFVEAREFVSLGCFCGVARALQALGIKRASYPFDWVRAPAEGIVHCLDRRFEDFLTFTAVTRPATVKQPVYVSTRWGGSFWHHDPSAPRTAGDFTRRAERFLGLGEVPAERPRIFVRSVNSTTELASTQQMLAALRRALPKCELRLLVLVDLQRYDGPRYVKGCSSDELLFYFLHEDLFQGTPTQPGSAWTMERHADAYSEAIAFACRLWSGQESSGLEERVLPVEDFVALEAMVEQWDGGSAAGELFFPRKFQGPRLSVGGAAPPPAHLLQQPQIRTETLAAQSHMGRNDSALVFMPRGDAGATVASAQALMGGCGGVGEGGEQQVLRPQTPRRLQLASPDNSPQGKRNHAMVSPFGGVLDECPPPLKESAATPTAQALAPLADTDGQTVDFLMPKTVLPGGTIEATAFGAPLRIILPEGAQSAQWLRLHLSKGVVSCERVAAAPCSSAGVK